MGSHSYELNGLNGIVCGTDEGDIGKIIGKGAKNLKKIIAESWSLYDKIQSSPKRIDEEKPKLRILFKKHDEGINVEIISESKIMQKLTKRIINKHAENYFKLNPLKTHHYAIEFPDRLIGKIIGKKGSGLKKILNDIIYQKDQCMIHEDDLDTAKTARIRIDGLGVDGDDKGQSSHLVDFVKGKIDHSFIGWPPSPEDEFEHYILIILSFKYGSKPFVDKSLYIERFTEVISDRINQIKQEDNQKLEEIDDLLDMNEDF
jgi:predicted RNA-binding protein YlqC (UPF0109 family)